MEKSKKKLWLFALIPVAVALIIAAALIASYFIRQNRPAEIRITSLSHKTEYYVGDALDTSALTVGLYSKAGFLRYLSADEYSVDGFDSSKPGECTLTVSYDGLQTGYTVKINELPAENPSYVSLEIYRLPSKTRYLVGENLNVNGGILQINYSNGSYERVELLPLMVSGFDSSAPGKVKVRVDYVGMVTWFEVEVVAQ